MANQKNRGEPGGGGVSPPTWGAVTAWPGPSSATPWPGQPAASQGVTGIQLSGFSVAPGTKLYGFSRFEVCLQISQFFSGLNQ